ncbi:MAG TPA: hypothetical protein VK858_06000 [Longimicrobiales bacterium]|nr:hypothetical protein [Longimicrobiales bacterium]
MNENRIEAILRDPTLEQPTLTYHEVRLPWQSFFVRPEAAARVLEAIQGLDRSDWVRVETVTGSVAFVRTVHVVYVREWTPAQRESERQFWDALDAEQKQPEDDAGAQEGSDGSDGGEASEGGTDGPEGASDDSGGVAHGDPEEGIGPGAGLVGGAAESAAASGSGTGGADLVSVWTSVQALGLLYAVLAAIALLTMALPGVVQMRVIQC